MTKHAKARRWRETLELGRHQLAKLTGYSYESITIFENGFRADGRPISGVVWQRYERACAAVDHELQTGEKFRW